jgi:hypothetical protein
MPNMKKLTQCFDQLTVGALAVVVGAVWYAALMRVILKAGFRGPICGHASSIGAHCPACYAALSLIGVGLGLMVASRTRRPIAIPNR